MGPSWSHLDQHQHRSIPTISRTTQKAGRSLPTPEPLILASYLPGEGHYRSEKYTVVPILCDTDIAYSQGLAAYWDHPGILVNLEHDLEVTDDQLAELIECGHPLCAAAYKCHWASTRAPVSVWAHTRDGVFVWAGDEWADWSAAGCVKMAPKARVGTIGECHWGRVENAIAHAVVGTWHLHWERDEHNGPTGLAHHHW